MTNRRRRDTPGRYQRRHDQQAAQGYTGALPEETRPADGAGIHRGATRGDMTNRRRRDTPGRYQRRHDQQAAQGYTGALPEET